MNTVIAAEKPTSATALLRGASLEAKVSAAIRVWKRLEPQGPRLIKEVAAKKRALLSKANGCSETGDISLSGIVPAMLVTILRLDPERALAVYGEDCGLGERLVDSHVKGIHDTIFRLMPECKISTLHGEPSRRGWA